MSQNLDLEQYLGEHPFRNVVSGTTKDGQWYLGGRIFPGVEESRYLSIRQQPCFRFSLTSNPDSKYMPSYDTTVFLAPADEHSDQNEDEPGSPQQIIEGARFTFGEQGTANLGCPLTSVTTGNGLETHTYYREITPLTYTPADIFVKASGLPNFWIGQHGCKMEFPIPLGFLRQVPIGEEGFTLNGLTYTQVAMIDEAKHDITISIAKGSNEIANLTIIVPVIRINQDPSNVLCRKDSKVDQALRLVCYLCMSVPDVRMTGNIEHDNKG